MSSCCEPVEKQAPAPATLTLALAGNPNSGKTTIFNALTGMRQKVANYPGVTIEKKTGRTKLTDGAWANVIDLPGTYSLISRSPDEQVAMEVLRGLRKDTASPDVVIVVVDASNLQRNLYLVSQLIELGRPMVIALNMTDIAERRGLKVSPEALEREIGVPVVPLVGHKKKGIDQLKAAVAHARVAPLPDWPLPDVVKQELVTVGAGLAKLDQEGRTSAVIGLGPTHTDLPLHEGHGHADTEQLEAGIAPKAWICGDDLARHIDRYEALAERLLIGDRAADIKDLAEREPVASLLHSARLRMAELDVEPMQADIEAHYRWIEGVASRSATVAADPSRNPEPGTRNPKNWTERADSVLIHKVWGLATFALIMATLFVAIFWVADPMMTACESAVARLGDLVTRSMTEGPLKDLIVNGIFAGVGGVVVFVPQIAMLFLFLAILEDSGYLARAAFLMDRLLAKVGLHGKSFIPMLSSFACAIPGIMATRTIENRKDRLATVFVAPFMSCSARLPVYGLLIGAFFGSYSAWVRGGIMFSLYAIGVLAAAGTAWIFKRSFLKGPTPAFILEMPSYKVPQLSQVGRQVWSNTSKFLTKAGTTIFCLSIVLWAMSYYPQLPPETKTNIENQVRAQLAAAPSTTDPAVGSASADASSEPSKDAAQSEIDKALAGAQGEYSIAGRLGHAMEPVIKPLGYDWKMGVGLVGAFAAREIFVSTMGIIYSVGDSEEDVTSLESAMKSDTYADGRPVWTPLVAASLLVWFVLAMQCISTLAIVRRETGGWRWPVAMLLYMNGLAYVVCLLIYQVGSRVLG